MVEKRRVDNERLTANLNIVFLVYIMNDKSAAIQENDKIVTDMRDFSDFILKTKNHDKHPKIQHPFFEILMNKW